METWFFITITLCISILIKSLLDIFFKPNKHKHGLPPGPAKFPIVGSTLWLRRSFADIESILPSLHKELGPIVTLYTGSRPNIFISDRSLAHQALVQNGAVFADRPRASAITKITSSNQINSSSYGSNWRVLRRNLMSEVLHPSRVKYYSSTRKWTLDILLERFESQSKSGDPVEVLGNFQYAMFCLLVRMCFGDQIDMKHIEEIKRVEHSMIVNARKFDTLNIMPKFTKILFKKLWSEVLELQKAREGVLIPLIRARNKMTVKNDDGSVSAYVDTLFDLQLPVEKRKLEEKEMASLLNEFLNAGTDTTSTALQWVMANLVKYPNIQEKLFMEIKSVVGDGGNEVKEDDLQKMPYLKAVILEGLRRHPPAHFVLPHAVSDDIVLGDYLIPKEANVNFMVSDMGWDSRVWEEPMAFKPERFMGSDGIGEVFDITGSKEIKMMPFGAGRRICPGYQLAMLHLEYFVANLVWSYEWNAVDGDGIDLSEKLEFTMVMKYPLKTHISPRFKAKNQAI